MNGNSSVHFRTFPGNVVRLNFLRQLQGGSQQMDSTINAFEQLWLKITNVYRQENCSVIWKLILCLLKDTRRYTKRKNQSFDIKSMNVHKYPWKDPSYASEECKSLRRLPKSSCFQRGYIDPEFNCNCHVLMPDLECFSDI